MSEVIVMQSNDLMISQGYKGSQNSKADALPGSPNARKESEFLPLQSESDHFLKVRPSPCGRNEIRFIRPNYDHQVMKLLKAKSGSAYHIHLTFKIGRC